MPQIAQLIGGAGTGKTTELLSIMSKVIETGISAEEIGFVSFTRAARSEAATRAAAQFGSSESELLNNGWFRTLHSVCFRCLGASRGEMLAGNRADKEWLAEALQEEVGTLAQDDGLAEVCFEGSTDAGVALNLWGAARNRLEPLEAVWRLASDCDDRTPDLEFCRETAARYEQAKRLDGRFDFVDLLARFAGISFTTDGPTTCQPRGFVPDVPVWFFDEQQDTSALLDAVCKRLIEPSGWVYVVGDPFQAIYGWAGADPKHFLSWPVAEGKKRIMPISYRCPAEILALGESILSECSDYWQRGIKAAASCQSAQIEEAAADASLVHDVDPRQSWLLIARTNREAARMGSWLTEGGVPWHPTKGNNCWTAPVKHSAFRLLAALQQGHPITRPEWKQVLKYLPSKMDGADLLVRGTKTKFESEADPKTPSWELYSAESLADLGATEQGKEFIRSGRWRSTVEDADRYCEAVERWGVDAVDRPKVRVGTIHSVKGSEAENVVLLTTSTKQIARGSESQAGADEEARVAYVAVTRTKRRLILANDRKARFKMRIPA